LKQSKPLNRTHRSNSTVSNILHIEEGEDCHKINHDVDSKNSKNVREVMTNTTIEHGKKPGKIKSMATLVYTSLDKLCSPASAHSRLRFRAFKLTFSREPLLFSQNNGYLDAFVILLELLSNGQFLKQRIRAFSIIRTVLEPSTIGTSIERSIFRARNSREHFTQHLETN
jgi:hypothetical protein